MNTIPPNDFSFYESLNEVVQREPATALDPELMGPRAAIGIIKGKPFAPDARGREALLELLAFEKSVKRVFSLAGVLDLRRGWDLHLSNDAVAQFLGGSPSDVPDHYREASPAEQHIPAATQKLIHGTADDSVPYEISQSYAERKKKAGENVELITMTKIGHFEIVDPQSAVWPRVEEVFRGLAR